MALAKFFDKAALAVAEVLRGIEHKSLASILGSHLIGLYFDHNAVSSSEGRLTLELSVNLLARLYPRIRLMPNGSEAEASREGLISIARSINPEITIDDRSEPTAVLAIGKTKTESSVPTIYMGSEGWLAHVSIFEPVSSGNGWVPFGAGAAACLGSATLFRLVFKDHLSDSQPDESLSISLFNYQLNSKCAGPSVVSIELEPTYLVGVGAIGNAAVWALARTSGISGDLHLIDHEAVELSNLQRYILATQHDIDSAKVAIAQRELGETSIRALAAQQQWGEYLRDQRTWKLPCIAVAVDTAEDRQAIQAAVPKYLINAWTQPTDLGVSRHHFVDSDACLTCLYMPDEKARNRDQIIAEAIGLPEALMEIRTLLYTGAPVGQGLLQRAAAAMGVPFDELREFENESLESFYTRAICGGIILNLGGTVHPTQLAVPLAFQSALAGILLASEIVIHAGKLRTEPINAITKMDLLHPMLTNLDMPAKKHYSGRCICQDMDFINSYNDKYGLHSQP